MPAFKYSEPYTGGRIYTSKGKSAMGWSFCSYMFRTKRNNLSKELQMTDRLEPGTFHAQAFKLVQAKDRNRYQCSTY